MSWSDSPLYGPVWRDLQTSYCYYRELKALRRVRGLPGLKLSFGPRQLFANHYRFMRNFHEVRINKIHFKLTHNLTSSKLEAAHPFEFSVVSLPIDSDALDLTNFQSFEHAAEHPSARFTVGLSSDSVVHNIIWTPTEPSELDWIPTTSKKLVHMYCFYYFNYSIIGRFPIHITVQATTHCSVRGATFSGTTSTSSMRTSTLRDPDLRVNSSTVAGYMRD